MKKFKDIKTGTQLLIGFGVLIFLMMMISYVAWQQTEKLAQQTEKLYNHPYTVRKAIGVLEASIISMRRDMLGLMLAGSEQEVEELLTLLDINKAEVFKQLGILELRYLGPAEDIKIVHEEFAKWNTIRAETIRLLLQGNVKEAANRIKANEVGGVQATRLFERITIIDDFANNRAVQFYSQSVKESKKLNQQLLVLSLTAIILSLLVATFLSRLINNPVKEIARAIDDYRSGNKAARSAYTSKNLLGKLTDSFNEMAGVVEIENLLSSRVAEFAGVMLSEDDARIFCNDVLKNMLKHTGSQMGAVYLLNDDQTRFERFACMGMDPEGCKPFSALHPEGEFGLALASRKISHIKEIPADSRFSFQTVSGNFKPREIITIPIFQQDRAVAIISIFSIYSYSEISIRLIENVFPTLTARMNSILTYKKMVELSEKLEEQNRELDIQKKELETLTDELKEQNAELEVQKEQLGEVSRLKTNFLSSMSHELRTPLNSVIALSGVLNRRLAKKIGDEEYSYLVVIERNGKHLLDLINDILDLSRIEAGKIEREKSSFGIHALLNDVVAMIKPQADFKGIGLNFAKAKSDAILESDYSKCFHIFQNIIGNAVKFTEKGNVDITVSTRKEHVVAQISDTGIGISKADIPHIFDEFRQADGSNSRKFGGTGLGLSIAKKYANLIGCEISVKSELGKGSVFTVSIPLKASYSTQEELSFAPNIIQHLPKPASKTDGNGKTILLVEDTEAMIVQMCDILEVEGYTVETARNGFDALDWLEKSIPDAMILDIMMPGMDGFELLNKIRGKKPTANLPVLVLTAKILTREELKVIKNNRVHQLIQKGKITQEGLLEAVAILMLKDEVITGMSQTKVVPVAVSGKPVVLAVEDNPDNMLALKALISERFEFIEAVNGIEGVEKALKHRPHLILMDIAMPEMNGFDALKNIRNEEVLKHTPVIVVTSSAMRGDKNYFIEYGFNGYVSKPINSELLFEEIFKWLKTEQH